MPRKKSDLTEDGQTVQVRFPGDLIRAVDQEAERVSEERGGEPVGRSEIIRTIVRTWAKGAPPPQEEPGPDVAELHKADVERLARERGTVAPHEASREEEDELLRLANEKLEERRREAAQRQCDDIAGRKRDNRPRAERDRDGGGKAC